ncbi:dihydropteroate synthase [Alphaproteobacteria bacterium]|nr:dihydropteroate synthase [Alphaproteobacteria bacterium]
MRGPIHSDRVFKNLTGGNIYFAAVRIISCTKQGLEEKIVSILDLDNFLKKKSTAVAEKIKTILNNIESPREALILNNGSVIGWKKPVIQGVLNVTPDSFSDGGQYSDIELARPHAHEMISAGADIIDIGGETTKPGAQSVSIKSEKDRVLPVIMNLATLNFPLSIDSRNAEVMNDAIQNGAHIINDVSALGHDLRSIGVVKREDVPIILMHAQGVPEIMQNNPQYSHILLDIYDYLESRIKMCIDAGIDKNKIIADPGIGFGKTVDHNLEILNGLSIFHGLGVPLLVGTSRKSFIGKITGEKVAENRVSGSIAAMLLCLEQGVQIVRVHDVEQATQAISVWNAAQKV